ncbi:MAG: sigma-70 family RNA polymerase sigma factor, partial [Acidobacteriota bacterium]
DPVRCQIVDSNIAFLHGVNFDVLERRDPALYGGLSLSELEYKIGNWAGELGLEVDVYHEWLVEIRALNIGSLESATPDEDNNRDLLQFISDDKEQWPSRLLERSELQKLLAQSIAKMPEVERTVLSLYYYEELTLREISKIVHLHESRISQLKSQAILRLRAALEKQWPTQRGL